MNASDSEKTKKSWREILAEVQTVLVTGNVGEDDSATFMRRRGFGPPSDDYNRVLALRRLCDDPGHWFPVETDHDSVEVVSCRQTTRSATTATSTAPTTTGIFPFVDSITDAVERLNSRRDADLRVAVDSLGDLIDTFSKPEVKAALVMLNESLEDGIIHYHYRRPDNDDLVREIGELVDLRIELAYPNHGSATDLRHRYHAEDQTSKWVALAPIE